MDIVYRRGMAAGALQLRHFEAMLEGTGIEVRASSVPGTDMRGLFAREDAPEGARLYTEVPLACWLSPALEAVQHARLRALLEGEGRGSSGSGTPAGAAGGTAAGAATGAAGGAPAGAPPAPAPSPPLPLRCCQCLAAFPLSRAVFCEGYSPEAAGGRPRACLDVYCSAACRERAAVLHHAMTCPDAMAAGGPSSGAQLEAVAALARLSDPSLPFTPIVVLRVMAGLFSRALAALLQTEDESLSLEYAFAPYARLFGSGRAEVENYPMDEAYAWTRAFFDDVAGCYARAAPTVTFGGHDFALTRQTFLAPEFYSFVVSALCFNALAVAVPAGPAGPAAPAAAPGASPGGAEDVVGAALFQCLSNLNHSCEPNCQVDFPEGTAEGTLRLLRAVGAGEELFITYVCPEEPLSARRERLAPYQFTCRCPKCAREERQAAPGRRGPGPAPGAPAGAP